MRHVALACFLLALLAGPALADATVEAQRRVTRLVASPLPLTEARMLSDQHAWRVDVPPEGVVEVTATSETTGLFYLRANRTAGAAWLPGPAASLVLSEPGIWRVEVDPVAGAPVDIHITFRGFAAGQGGAAMPFGIRDLEAERGCILAGVCLP